MKALVIIETVILVFTYVVIACSIYGADDKNEWKSDWKTFNKPTANDVLLTFDELKKIAESNLLYGDAYGASEANAIYCFIVQREAGSLLHWHVLLDYKDYKKYVKWLKQREEEARVEALRASHEELVKNGVLRS